VTNSNDSSTTDATDATKKAAAERKAKLANRTEKPHPNLGKPFSLPEVPQYLAKLKSWCVFIWDWDNDAGGWTKLPMRYDRTTGGFKPGVSNDPKKPAGRSDGVMPLADLLAVLKRLDPTGATYGVMFLPKVDPDGERYWVCVDVDGVDPDNKGTWPALIADSVASGACGWMTRSVSGKGLRLIGSLELEKWTKANPGSRLKNAKADGRGFELKANTASTVTSDGIGEGQPDITDLWMALELQAIAAKAQPAKAAKPKRSPVRVADESDPELMAKVVAACEAYVAKADSAIAGAGGHDAFIRVCGIIASGYGLRGPEGEAIARAWNQHRCEPPFSESDFIHKWTDAVAEAETDPRGPTLRDSVVRNHQRTLKRRGAEAGPANIPSSSDAAPDLGQTAGEQATEQPAASADPEPSDSEPASEPESSASTATDADDGGEPVLAKRARDGRWIVITSGDRLDDDRKAVCHALKKSAGAQVYQRGGRAAVVQNRDVSIDWVDPVTGQRIRRGPTARPTIAVAEHGHMLSAISGQITFRRVKKDQETGKLSLERVGIPGHISVMVRQCPNELNPLRGLLFGPSYDSEFDRVLSEPGYHPGIGFHNTSDLKANVPDLVSRDDAVRAVETFLAPFRFFPWPESDGEFCLQRVRLLVAALTAMLRWSFGPAPAISLSGKAAGSGKSEIFKALSIICHGGEPRLMNWVTGRDSDLELRKRIVMLLASGESFVLLDNLPNGLTYESPTLDAVLTSESFYDRALGTNSAGGDVGGPNRLAIFLTGNSIQPCSDLGERVLRIEFTAPPDGPRRLVNPDKFSDEDGKVGLLLRYVAEHREKLLTALLVICRGYQQAGRPKMFDSHWGSFPSWKQECVDPIAWATGRDPLEGLKEELEEAAELADGLPALIAEWHEEFGPERLSSRDLKVICTPCGPMDPNRTARLAYRPEFAEALASATRTDNVGDLSNVALGRRLQVFAGRLKDGPRPAIEGKPVAMTDGTRWMLMTARDKVRNQQLFWVQQLKQANPGEFTGGRRLPEVSAAQNSNGRGCQTESDTETPHTHTTTPPIEIASGNNLRTPPNLRRPSLTPESPSLTPAPAGLSNTDDAAQRWLPELAKFAASPVTRGDLREWFDINGIHETVRVVLSRHLKTVAHGKGTGVQYDPDAFVRANDAGNGRA